MSNVAIRLENLSKAYRITEARRGQGTGAYKTLQEDLLGLPRALWSAVRREPRNHYETVWALRNVSLEIKWGEMVGVIGRNGAGKSTMLKILSRITEPTTGHADVYGRIGSLLEVGTGFHPELTGRENIFLNGGILGMRRSDIARKFDEIVAFAEVERYIDTPVKRYSSGMYVRLAFSVAAHLEPEILLVDEVLAVGDVGFQKKCLGKMGSASKEGRTVLFVSHNIGAVNSLCSRCISIVGGQVAADGPTLDVTSQYLRTMSGAEMEGEALWADASAAPGTERLRLHAVRIVSQGKVASHVPMDLPITVEIEFWNYVPGLTNLCVSVFVRDEAGTLLFATVNTPNANALEDDWFSQPHPTGLHRACLTIPASFLNDGRFYVGVFITQLDGRASDVYQDNLLFFEVIDTGNLATPGMGKWGGLLRTRMPWRTTLVAPLPTG